MTIDVESTIVSHFGNGSAREFSFGFTVPDGSSQIKVFTVDPAGTETERTEGIGSRSWSVNIPGDGYPASGGSVTYPSNGAYRLPAGHKIVIKRVLRFEQDLDLTAFGAYNPESLERQLDRQVMLAQQNRDLIAGAGLDVLADEPAKRAAGDDLQSITVGSLAGFRDAVNAQATSDQPLELVIGIAAIVFGGDTYNMGDVLRYAPRSTSPERRFNVVDHKELSAEARQRQSGDEWREHTGVSSEAELTASITAHNQDDAEHTTLVVIDTAFTTATRSYADGQRWLLAPHHNAEGDLVLVSEAGGGGGQGGSGEDTTARAAAAAAQKLAGDNKARLDGIPVYAATMAVWPPNVAKHSGFQRTFQSTLSGVAGSLATDGGSTGTRFTNVFRVFTRLSDGTVVQLHTQGWAYTSDDRQTVEWEVSAAEFNSVGASAATNGVEVWGEFRAVYGGGVNELRGTTNPVFIDFGEQDEWPATRGELKGLGAGSPLRTNFGVMTVERTVVATGYEFTGYASTLPSGSIAGTQSEPISGIYTATVRTTTAPEYAAIVQGASYFAQNPSGSPSVPLYVIIDGVSYSVRHNVDRFYEIVDFGGFLKAGTHRVQVIFTNGRTWIQNPPVDAGGLTQAQQIALLNVSLSPGGITYAAVADLATDVQTIRVRVSNPELLTGEVWVSGQIQGQPGTGARQKWASTTAGINISVAANTGRDIATALIAGGDEELELSLHFHDAASAGNEIERRDFTIPVVHVPAAPAAFDPNTVDGISGGDVTQIDNARTGGFQGLSVWYGTKAQYDAISNKDPSTIYFYPPA